VSSRQQRRRTERVMLQLTENEVLVLLAAATKALVNFGPPEDAEERETLAETQSAVEKLRRMVGMDAATYERLSAMAEASPRAFSGVAQRPKALAAADPSKVRALMEELVARFEEYVSEHETAYLDAFMGIHNAHKAVVVGLARRDGAPKAAQRMLLVMARDTWADAMHAELRKLADA